MPLIYRAIWTDDQGGRNFLDLVRDHFTRWCFQRVGSDLVNRPFPDGAHTVVVGAHDDGSPRTAVACVRSIAADDGSLQGIECSQHRDHGQDRWVTWVRAALRRSGKITVAIDQEHHTDKPVKRVTVSSPRIARQLLRASSQPRFGLPIERGVVNTTRVSAPALVGHLTDPGRQLPAVVCTESTEHRVGRPASEHAVRLCERTEGLASVFLLDRIATTAFCRQLRGTDLGVFGGSIRAYQPGLQLTQAKPASHPYVPSGRLASAPRSSIDTIVSEIAKASTRRDLPTDISQLLSSLASSV